MAINAGTVAAYLELDASKFTNALKSAISDLKNFGDSSSSITSKIGSLGSAMTTVGSNLTKYVSVPIAGAGIATLKFSTDFNKSMANVATLIPGNTQRVNELKGGIQDLGIRTGKATSDIADGVYQVISAFGDTNDTLKITEINAKAAAAGMATTTDAINLTSAVTKGYGDTSAIAVQKASDLAFQTVKLGQTTFPELAASLGKVVPLSKQLGVSQEEMFNIFATGTGVTGNASEVSTQYRGVLQALMAPTKSMSGLFEELGIKNGEAMIKQYGLMGSIEKIVAAANASGVPLQNYIGSIEGQTIALALTGAQSDVYKDKLGQMEKASGAMTEAFNEQTKGVNASGFAFEQAKQSMVVAAQRIGDALAPALKSISEIIIRVTDKLKSMDDTQIKTIVTIAGIVAAIGPALLIMGQLIISVSAIAGAFSAAASAISAAGGIIAVLTGPIGITIGVIAGLIAIGVLLYKNWDTIKVKAIEIKDAVVQKFNEIKTGISNTFENIKNSVSQFKDSLVQKFNEIKTKATEIWNSITSFLTTTLNLMKNIFTVVFLAIKSVVEGTFLVIKTIIQTVINVVKGIIQLELNIIKAIFTAVWSAIGGTVTSVMNSIKSVIQTIWNGIKSFFTSIFNVIKSIIVAEINGWKQIITTVMNAIKTVITTVWNGIKAFLVPMLNSIKNTITTVFNSVNSFISTVWNKIKNDITNIVNSIKSIITNIFNSIKATLTTIVNSISSAVVNTFNSIKLNLTNIFNSVKSIVLSAWTYVYSTIYSKVQSAYNTVSSIFNSVRSVITNIFNNIKSTVSSVWQSIYSTIYSKIQSAYNAVSSIVSSIRSKFSFSLSLPGVNTSTISSAYNSVTSIISRIRSAFNISLRLPSISIPHIPLPHFYISGSFSIAPPRVPSLGVSWYDKGGIFNSPSIIGVGEKRPEFVGALEDLNAIVTSSMKDVLSTSSINNSKSQTNNITINVTSNSGDRVVRELRYALGGGL